MMSKAELEDMYHTCRWCKYYQGGVCINEAFTACRDTLSVYAVAEDGRLSECIRETLGSISTDKVERELRYKLEEFHLSNKRIDEVIQLFREKMEELFDAEYVEKLDGAISRLYQNDADTHAESSEGVDIADPHSFYCKEFF